MKQPHIWVLVMDGGAAQIYRNTGRQSGHQAILEVVPGGNFTHEAEYHSGARPDLAFASGRGDAPHTVNADDGRKRMMQERFVKEVIGWLVKPEHQDAFDHLVIAAPPRVLGEIRVQMPAALSAKVLHEFHADLVKAPIKDIEKHVLPYLNPVQSTE